MDTGGGGERSTFLGEHCWLMRRKLECIPARVFWGKPPTLKMPAAGSKSQVHAPAFPNLGKSKVYVEQVCMP